MKPDKIASYISLAMKAGKVASGEFATEKSVKEGRAALVVLADDASENTRKKFTDMCRFYRTPVITYQTRETLGHLIGRDLRASLAIEDAGFARAIVKMREENK